MVALMRLRSSVSCASGTLSMWNGRISLFAPPAAAVGLLPLTRAGPAESMEAATVVAAVFIIEDLLVMIAPSGIDRPKVDRLRAGAHLSNGPAPQVTAPGRTSLSPLAE